MVCLCVYAHLCILVCVCVCVSGVRVCVHFVFEVTCDPVLASLSMGSLV